MAQTADSASTVARAQNREAPAWLAFLDLVCVTAAALLWTFVPAVGPYALIVAMAPVVTRLFVTGRLSERTPFDLPLGLFLLTAGLGVWAAYDREAAWTMFWLIVGGILLFYALANAAVLGRGRAWLPAALGAAVAAYFLMTNDWAVYPGEIAVLARQGEALQRLVPEIAGPRLNPNEAGGILAMLLPFAAWVTWDAWRQAHLRRASQPLLGLLSVAVASLMLCITILGLLMSGSRGAWLALGVGFYAGGSWLAAGRLARLRPGRRLWVWLGLLVLGALLAALAAVVVSGIDLLPAALMSPATLYSRAGFYRYALLLAKDYAFLGAGLDGFLMLYASYALLTHVGYISNSHNLYLGVAIAQGIPGLLALVWMWAVLALLAWRHAYHAARKAGGTIDVALTLTGIAALSGVIVLVHGLFESALYGKGVVLLFVPLAFPLPDEHREGGPAVAQRKRRVVLASGVVLALALAVILAGPAGLLAQFHANLAAVHQGQAELGLYSWPEWPVQDAVRRAVDLERPVAEFERALSLDPANGTANRRLGTIQLSLGEYEDALRHLVAAYSAEGWSVTTRQLLGEALVVNGHVDQGRALWTEVNNGQMQLELRAFWYGYIGDEEREAAVRLAASEQ